MQSLSTLKTVPDDEILARLCALLAASRVAEADIVAHIAEIDARRLYAREATSSMFAYCLERLHLSEHEAYRRIAAARASREHPVILDMLADGRLHLTAVALLAPLLTRESCESLLQRATHKTRREVEEIVADLAPRPDAPASIRKLPRGRLVASTSPSERVDSALRPEQVDSDGSDGLVVATPAAAAGCPASGPQRAGASPACAGRLGSPETASALRWAAASHPEPARIQPLSPERYKIQFTASAELRDKLERLKALMRSSVPDGDLSALIEAAVTEKIDRLEARRFGRTKSPRNQLADAQAAATTRHVPAAVRRTVLERDEGRCRFVDAQGRRCTARVALQFHHREPFAFGGQHSLRNVSVLCSAHNRYLARLDFGAAAVGKHRRGSA